MIQIGEKKRKCMDGARDPFAAKVPFAKERPRE